MATEVGVLPQEELAAIAKTELNEEPGRLATDLEAIKEWISKQSHLQNISTGMRNLVHICRYRSQLYVQSILDDNLLTFFLRGCKFSLERTKEKLDFFYSVRSALPEWFNNWDKIDGALDVLESGYDILNTRYITPSAFISFMPYFQGHDIAQRLRQEGTSRVHLHHR